MGITNPSVFGGCIPMTADLQDFFGKNTPMGRESNSIAFLQWLKSAENTSGVRQFTNDLRAAMGKKRTIQLMFEQPMCLTVCTADFACDDVPGEIKPAIQFLDVNIDTRYFTCDANGDPIALTFEVAEFEQYCNLDDESFLRNKFSEFDYAFLRALDKELVQLFSANIPSTAEVQMPFLRTVNGVRVLVDEFMLWIDQKISDVGMNMNDYVFFGGQFIKTLQYKFKVATASQEGFDVTKQLIDMPNLYYDRNFDSAFGANAFVAIPKKAVQLVTWVQNKGLSAFQGETQIKFTKTAPLGNGSSLEFDYDWKREVDCPKFTYFPSLYMELVKAIPGGCLDSESDGIFIFKDCSENLIPEC
jgi:hypothetical protein